MTMSDQTTQYIDKEIRDAAMTGMLDPGYVFELINDRLDNRAITKFSSSSVPLPRTHVNKQVKSPGKTTR